MKSKIRRSLRDWVRAHPFELFVTLLYSGLVFFLPMSNFDGLSYNHWASHIRQVGIARTYELRAINYMPLSMIAIALWDTGAKVSGRSATDVSQLIKIYPLFFDWLSVLFLLAVARRLGRSLWLVIFFTISNIAWHYNAFIWGQFDGVYTFFSVVAMYLLLQKRLVLGLIAFILALNAKLQAIIYLPLIALAIGFLCAHWKDALPKIDQGRYLVKKILYVLFAGVLLVSLQQFLMWPFSAMSSGEILAHIWKVSVALQTSVTVNADNFWVLMGVRAFELQDTALWLFGITYRSWGHGLLIFFSLLTCAPLSLLFLEALFRKARFAPESAQLLRLFSLAGYQLSLVFFFFLTQMHERYSHPVLFFSILLMLLGGSPVLVLLTSLAYFINLERVMHFWQSTSEIETVIRLDVVSALLFANAFVLSWVELWRVRHFFSPKLPLAKPASS